MAETGRSRRQPSEMEIIDAELGEMEALLRKRQLDSLDNIVRAITTRAEKQRRAIGAGYRAGNSIRRCEKLGVKAIDQGKSDIFERCRENFYKLWKNLQDCDLPSDIAWQHDGQAGQELVEFFGVCEFYPLLSRKIESRAELTKQCREILVKLWQTLGDSYTDEGLKDKEFCEECKEVEKKNIVIKDGIHKINIRYQTFLNGLCDVPGELQKLVKNILIKEDTSNDDLSDMNGMSLIESRMLIRKHLVVITAIYEFLDNFELCYGQVINDSRMRGFRNTYRGAMRKVVMAIDVAERWLLDIKFKLGKQ